MKITRKQRAYDYIREKLLHGSLGVGDRLSPEALAREIGTSHIPVREALGQLEREGLVVQIPHRGTFVRQPDRREIEEVMELRGLLECRAASQAARRITAAGLEEMQTVVRAMREVVAGIRAAEPGEGWALLSRWGALEIAFHRIVFDAAGNRQSGAMARNLVMRVSGYGYSAYRPAKWTDLLDGFAGNYRVHREVYLAVRSRDPRAARRAMQAHMRRARKNLLIRFEGISRTLSGRPRSTSRFDRPPPSPPAPLPSNGRGE